MGLPGSLTVIAVTQKSLLPLTPSPLWTPIRTLTDPATQTFFDFLVTNNLPATEEILLTFNHFYELLVEAGKKTNLIGLREKRDVYEKLFADSLVIAALTPLPQRIVDVGSGAGFPGIPLAIIAQHIDSTIELTLVEPRNRRAEFLSMAVKTLGLTNVSVVSSRVETVIKQRTPGSSPYQLAVSKAFQPPEKWVDTAKKLTPEGWIAILYTARLAAEVEEVVKKDDSLSFVRVVNDISELGLPCVEPVRSAAILSHNL